MAGRRHTMAVLSNINTDVLTPLESTITPGSRCTPSVSKDRPKASNKRRKSERWSHASSLPNEEAVRGKHRKPPCDLDPFKFNLMHVSSPLRSLLHTQSVFVYVHCKRTTRMLPPAVRGPSDPTMTKQSPGSAEMVNIGSIMSTAKTARRKQSTMIS